MATADSPDETREGSSLEEFIEVLEPILRIVRHIVVIGAVVLGGAMWLITKSPYWGPVLLAGILAVVLVTAPLLVAMYVVKRG